MLLKIKRKVLIKLNRITIKSWQKIPWKVATKLILKQKLILQENCIFLQKDKCYKNHMDESESISIKI
jgi:hypothetical protein